MHRHYLLQILILISGSTIAQDKLPGLEGIIVERFYTTGQKDCQTKYPEGNIPEGSVTYRIFLDLDSGYRFQAAYGSPDHALVIKSDQPIYNHPEGGYTHPNIQPLRVLRKNTALLDSWLSVGAASENHIGIPRIYDHDGKDSLVNYEKGYFTNQPDKKSIPFNQADGMIRVEKPPYPTFFQIDSCLAGLGSVINRNELIIQNGAWASLGKGTVGADSLTTNSVLIAQITTTGKLEFDLNIMIGTPDGESIRYVSQNPIKGERLHPALHYSSEKSHRKERKKKNRKNKTV